MDNIVKRSITYSLLAHIRGKGKLVGGPIQIFIPLIKRTLSLLNEKGIYSGKSIIEIKDKASDLYSIDFPLPVLRKVLASIAKEVNIDGDIKVQFNQDDSFQIKRFTFTEFEEAVKNHIDSITRIEQLFKNFCDSCSDNKPKEHSILLFIEKNKKSLAKYFYNNGSTNGQSYAIEAQFVDYFKQIPAVYEIIRNIYLGSILSTFIEFKTEKVKTGIELVFDTNFLLGLLDLNTSESRHTCNKIVDITKSQGYRLFVLKDTLREAVSLLKAKIENFDLSFLQKSIYPEDIYNACERRNLNKADLERIADNFDNIVNSFGVNIIYDTSKWTKTARWSKEYESLKRVRHNDLAALHDAIMLIYIREKRGKKIRDFENVNCWGINNAINREKYSEYFGIVDNHEIQPEIIKADDFLNIIWLSNPSIEANIDINDLADIGISSLISLGLSDSLPKTSIIQELDENIHKYSKEGEISDSDILRIATRITTRQLNGIESLNKLAKDNKEQFVKRINEEAKKQRELEAARIKQLDKIMAEFSHKSEKIAKTEILFKEKSTQIEEEAKSLNERLMKIETNSTSKDREIEKLSNELVQEKINSRKIENNHRTVNREIFINNKVKKWRRKIFVELMFSLVLFLVFILILFCLSEWQFNKLIQNYTDLKNNVLFNSFISIVIFIFSSITMKKLYDSHYNYSNIVNFKKEIIIPDELKDLK